MKPETGSDGSPLPEPDGSRYAQVAVPVPLRQTFTYRLPDRLAGRVTVGSRVAVPFGRRKLIGIVVKIRDELPPDNKIKAVKEVAAEIDPEPVFTEELLAFLVRAADYYFHPPGEVLRAASPALPARAERELRQQGFLDAGEKLPGARVATRRVLLVRPLGAETEKRLGSKQRLVLELVRERGEVSLDELGRQVRSPRATVRSLEQRGLVATEEREVPADRFFSTAVEPEAPFELTAEQQRAVDAINGRLERGGAFLLHGVTGSGKTEVYLRVIAEARARNLGALVLVPEIALTPQLVARFRARFGDAIAVLHSGLGNRQRHDAWHCLRQGLVNLAIGARSALFAPVHRLGVVIVDEEHDGSFKQEEGFRYHARDLALMRAHRSGAVCVLGSATPSVESYHGARQGRLQLLELPRRVTGHALPQVQIVDLGRHRGGPSGHRLLTGPMHRALERCLLSGDQAILFINRRGFAPSVHCTGCGELQQCPACSVTLTEHRRAGALLCHYCGFSTPDNDRCLYCGSGELERTGIGTEKLEDALKECFADVRVARLDRDTAVGEGIERVLDRLRRREIDVLVGTQMVTKGHDIPGVTLVGVMLADQSLAFPDFRAAERTFQLLAQVAGRAGRGEKAGLVLVQSYQPDHPAVRAASEHDYANFFRQEVRARGELGYPPFARLVAVRVDAGGESQARRAVEQLAASAARHPKVRDRTVRLMGPAPAPISRLRGRFRFRLLLRSADRQALRSVAARVAERIERGLGPAHASLDVDPVSML